MDTDSRLEREQFVSHLNGTTTIEILSLTSLMPISILFRQCIIALIGIKLNRSNQWSRFTLDVACLCLPFLLSCTIMYDYCYVLFVTMITIIVASILWRYQQPPRHSLSKKKIDFNNLNVSCQLKFISYYRIEVNICTAIAILAVDFKIFPRCLAKAETYGHGLMDIGVGCFVLAAAIVAPEARYSIYRYNKKAQTARGKDNNLHQGNASAPFSSSLVKSLKSIMPLVVIGVGRLIATAGINYQLHVSEYGVHWNFFFTLAAIRLLASLIFIIIPISLSGLIGACIGVFYQVTLTNYNLKDVIISGFDGSGGRNGIIEANREGIFSCIGYLSLYLIGIEIGKQLLKPISSLTRWLKVLVILIIVDIVLWELTWFNAELFEPVSRRFANFSYVLWMLAFMAFNIFMYLLVELISTYFTMTGNFCEEMPLAGCSVCTPTLELRDTELKMTKQDSSDRNRTCACLYAAIERNQLGYFLLANVMTGSVNLSMNTIRVDNILAAVILVGYIYAVSFIIVVLHVNKVTTKIW